MSFRLQPPAPARPNRCQLFGPGSRPALFEKMAASAADVINLDLEDSVAPSDKDAARVNIIAAISTIAPPISALRRSARRSVARQSTRAPRWLADAGPDAIMLPLSSARYAPRGDSASRIPRHSAIRFTAKRRRFRPSGASRARGRGGGDGREDARQHRRHRHGPDPCRPHRAGAGAAT